MTNQKDESSWGGSNPYFGSKRSNRTHVSGETVRVYAVLSETFDDTIFVEGRNPIHGALLDQKGHSLGITKKSLESLPEKSAQPIVP